MSINLTYWLHFCNVQVVWYSCGSHQSWPDQNGGSLPREHQIITRRYSGMIHPRWNQLCRPCRVGKRAGEKATMQGRLTRNTGRIPGVSFIPIYRINTARFTSGKATGYRLPVSFVGWDQLKSKGQKIALTYNNFRYPNCHLYLGVEIFYFNSFANITDSCSLTERYCFSGGAFYILCKHAVTVFLVGCILMIKHVTY